jgi:hypothetical protein
VSAHVPDSATAREVRRPRSTTTGSTIPRIRLVHALVGHLTDRVDRALWARQVEGSMLRDFRPALKGSTPSHSSCARFIPLAVYACAECRVLVGGLRMRWWLQLLLVRA